MEVLKILTLIVQFGLPPEFPAGDANLQQGLEDKIEVVCKDNFSGQMTTLHVLKNNPKFKKTTPSLFTEDNTKNLYIFLTHIDSTYLYIEDCDYSMLKFLRQKTKHSNLNFTVVDSANYNIKEEKLRVIRWSKGIDFKIFENSTVFETKFDTYMEFWQCVDKLGFAQKYPFVKPKPTALRKNYTEDQSEDLKYILSHPIMVLSVIPLDDLSYDLPFNLVGKSFETSLETTGEGDIEGTGIDLDGDKTLDAFWYMDIVDIKPVEVFTRLYINVEGKWKPVWYTYFKER